MTFHVLDNPVISSILFYPRAAVPGTSRLENTVDGTIPVAGDIVLGYRLYAHAPGAPVILYFHGNGEVAGDYDGIAPHYHRAGASLWVVDYRGYGWSTGKPKASALLSDVAAVLQAVPDVLGRAGLAEAPLFVMGRSLGSACAIHAAHHHPERFRGLIVESGFAQVLPLLARLGLPAGLLSKIPDPGGNVRQIETVGLPLLVIHGERDDLIPVSNGQALYDASPAVHKRIVRLAGAGHNDLMFYGLQPYFSAIEQFISEFSQSKE